MIARLLFSCLLSALLNKVYAELTKKDAAEMTAKINSAITNMLTTTTLFYTPFIACLLVCAVTRSFLCLCYVHQGWCISSLFVYLSKSIRLQVVDTFLWNFCGRCTLDRSDFTDDSRCEFWIFKFCSVELSLISQKWILTSAVTQYPHPENALSRGLHSVRLSAFCFWLCSALLLWHCWSDG